MTRRDRALTKMQTGQPLTAGDVAHILQLNPQTVSRPTRAGSLPHFRGKQNRRLWHADGVKAAYEDRRFQQPKSLRDPVERLLARTEVETQTGCWLWQGARDTNGYGTIGIGRTREGTKRKVRVHILAHETWIGPIPDGYHVDHVSARGCRYKHCFNPDHLEAVTAAENTQRWYRDRYPDGVTHCIRGHVYDETNKYVSPQGTFYCRTCSRLSAQRRRAAS